MKKKKALTLPFASLLGIGSRAARAEDFDDEDERQQREDESDEDYAKRMLELDKKEESDEDEREKETRHAAVDDDDEEDDEKKSDKDIKAARKIERARCARIIAHGIKVGAVRQAGVFAFDTSISCKAAIAALNASYADAPSPSKVSLGERMTAIRPSNPGAGSSESRLSLAEQIVLAGKKRRGEI